MNIIEQKKDIRLQMRAAKKNISIEHKVKLSELIFEHIEKIPQFIEARTILLYAALSDEVQTELFISKWFGKKNIVLPVVDGENLLLKEYNPQTVAKGYQSIMEPQSGCAIDAANIEFAIIPGVSFDRQNNRLGRGKGFYDRFLSEVKCMTIGVGFEVQIVDKLPIESFDKPMDAVVTEIGIVCTKA